MSASPLPDWSEDPARPGAEMRPAGQTSGPGKGAEARQAGRPIIAPPAAPMVPSAGALRALAVTIEAAAGLPGSEHRIARQLAMLAGEVRRLEAATDRRQRIASAVGRYVERRTA